MRGAVLIFAALCLRAQAPSSQSPPPYFDPPDFIVAGVADPSAHGGHGSDPVFRSSQDLANATARLGAGAVPDTNPLETARALQRAAERDPSEPNLFNWGAELLTHRAADQAVEVFSKGHRLFPHSTRTLLGLAVALYSRGSYDTAAQAFFEAADLDPADPAPYRFLGRVSSAAITGLDGYAARMQRFARLHPDNAWANYYYAATLPRTSPKTRELLEKAVRLDPNLGEAFLMLGTLDADEGNLAKAIDAFQAALRSSPQSEEAHYRLAMAYRKTGDTREAQKELELYQELQKRSAEAQERERSQIQQFVFGLKQ